MALAIPPTVLGMQCSGDIGGYTLYTDSRMRTVCFPRHPPKVPRSALQALQRTAFGQAVYNWHDTSPATREAYEQATLTLALQMTGLNLWISLSFSQDESLRQTLSRQSRQVLPLPPDVRPHTLIDPNPPD